MVARVLKNRGPSTIVTDLSTKTGLPHHGPFNSPLDTVSSIRVLSSQETMSLEYKREPYRLPDEKSELAKDIAGLANSTRRNGAIGRLVIGVGFDGLTPTFHDVEKLVLVGEAQIQQMVNSLVDPPIRFSFSVEQYEHEAESHRIVVISIPHSTRKPHLIKNDFSHPNQRQRKLWRGQCFARRGTSTEIASREEIAEMVHDADQTFSPIARVLKYAESIERTGHKIDAESLRRMLLDDELLPTFHAPLLVSLSFVSTNAEGVHVTRQPVSQEAVRKQDELVLEAARVADSGDLKLAQVIVNSIPAPLESTNACLVSAAILTRLDLEDDAKVFIERALELNPELPQVNMHAAQFASQFSALGDALIYCERGIERIDESTHNDICAQLFYLAATNYHTAGIKNRTHAAVREFLIRHPQEDEARAFVYSLLDET